MGYSRFSAIPQAGLIRTGVERATLVRRTYSLVLVSVLMTVVGAWFAMSNVALMQSVVAHPWITMILWFAPLLVAQGLRARPINQLALILLFAAMSGVMMSPLVLMMERSQPGVAMQAGGLTLSAFGVLTAYAFVSRRDFSAWGSFFSVGLWVLIATSLLNLFFHNQTASLWLAGGMVLVFSGLLVFDTWRIRNVYGPDDYVPAAVSIYLDLLNMFLAILQLLGGGRRN
jgi:modulator of FtsH protease